MAGESRDVQNFKFKQIRKLGIFNISPSLSNEVINLLAISNSHDLIFVGCAQGFKVLKLDDILKLEQNKDINRTIAESYKSKDINLNAQPLHLALSCDDLTFSVCLLKDDASYCFIYNVSLFLQNDFISIEPIASFRLTNNAAISLTDLMWNPATNNMFAVCLSDGTITVYDINENQINVIGSLKCDATAICWSPKGKQLLAGKGNGEMVQYKPNLQAVKTIPVPGLFEKRCSVASVLWISSFSFATAYRFPDWNEEGISLIIVDTPKNATPNYTLFEDICYSSSNENKHRYLMIHQHQWRILLCASTNSMEVGVLGFSNENVWEQWFLDDSGRAELPLDGKDEMYPIGMAINYTSTKSIPIEDNLTLSPMPILFLLSTKGYLCPFHVINLAPNIPNLQKRPELSQNEGLKSLKVELRQPVTNITGDVATIGPKNEPFGLTDGSVNNELSTSMISVEKDISAEASQKIFQPGFSLSKIPVTIAVNKSIIPAPSPIYTSSVKTANMCKANQKSAFQPPSVNYKQMNHGKDVDTNVTSDANDANSSLLATLYTNCIAEEILSFSNELVQLKRKTLTLKCDSNQNLLLSLKESLETLEKFSKEIKTTSASLNQDVHSLKIQLLETFAMLDEAISLQSRNIDTRYRQLLQSRSLDPCKVKKMKEIRSLHYYIRIQMNAVNQKMNEINTTGKKNLKLSNLYLPTTEAIYQTICNMQNIIENTSLKLSQLQELMEEVESKGYAPYSKAIANINNKMKPTDNLHECFNQMCLGVQSSTKPKKINTERESLLREMLEHRLVTPIRSSVPGSVFHLTIPETVLNASRVQKTFNAANSNANVTFVHPEMASTPISNSFRPLTTTLHSNASIPTTNPSRVQLRSPFSLLVGEKSIQSREYSEAKLSDSVKILANNSKFSSASFSPNVTNDKLFTVGTLTANKSDVSSGILFGNKSSSATTFILTYISPDSSLSVVKFGSKNVPEFQFQPVEAKNRNLLGAKEDKNLFQSLGNDVKSIGNSERIIATSLKSKLKTTDDKTNFTVETILEDVTPPSTPSEDEDDDDDNDDLEDVEAEDLDKCSDDLEGVVIEEIFESEEPHQKDTRVKEDADIIVEKSEQKFKVLTDKDEDFQNNISKSISNIHLNVTIPPQISATESTKSMLSISSSEYTAVKEINVSNSENTPINVTISSSKQLATSTNVGFTASSFSFRQTTETIPFKLNVFQDQVGIKYKQSIQKAISDVAVTTPTSSIASELKQLASPINTSQKPTTEVEPISFFGPVITPSSPEMLPFGSNAPASTVQTNFSQATTSPSFGTFGTPAITSETAATSTFTTFGRPFATATSVSAIGTSTSPLNSSMSLTPAFGTAVFGQKSSFGQAIDSPPVFGQPAHVTEQSGRWTFGDASNSVFGQNQNTTPSFGAVNTSTVFGQGGFFSGLGAKPSPENANKNVFGERSSFGSPGNTNLFGNQRQSNFSTPAKFGLTGTGFSSSVGSFSGGCSSVANAGFGGFQTQQQQEQISPKLVGFGSTPSFGQQPAFGGGPTFGGSPNNVSPFGSTNVSLGNAQNTGFGAMATQQQSATFGSLAQQSRNVFGNQEFGAGQFGQQQQQMPFSPNANFSTPNSGTSSSSSFSQWR